MKQDIRDLFSADDEFGYNKLPVNHKKDFVDKLKANSKSKKKNWRWFQVAAVVLICFGLGFVFLDNETTDDDQILIAQIEKVEKEYLKNINTEWQNFLAIATDQNLINRYEEKLSDLDKDYQEISQAFRKDTNNILVVESLIQNLQTRLQLLKDIQEHINILNQKTEQNEEII